MPQKNQFVMSKLFPLLFIVLGAAITIVGFPRILKANASRGWPTTEGTVVLSELGSTPSSSNSRGSIFAKVHYSFSVNEIGYTGKKVAYGSYGSSNNKGPGKIIRRYPEGMTVTVHYMPENPEECVLEPGIKLATVFLSGVGFAFLIAGCLFAYLLNSTRIDTSERHRRIS